MDCEGNTKEEAIESRSRSEALDLFTPMTRGSRLMVSCDDYDRN